MSARAVGDGRKGAKPSPESQDHPSGLSTSQFSRFPSVNETKPNDGKHACQHTLAAVLVEGTCEAGTHYAAHGQPRAVRRRATTTHGRSALRSLRVVSPAECLLRQQPREAPHSRAAREGRCGAGQPASYQHDRENANRWSEHTVRSRSRSERCPLPSHRRASQTACSRGGLELARLTAHGARQAVTRRRRGAFGGGVPRA